MFERNSAGGKTVRQPRERSPRCSANFRTVATERQLLGAPAFGRFGNLERCPSSATSPRWQILDPKIYSQAVEITCQGHPAIVLFSPSMKILKFAAVSLLVFGTIAANDVAPSNSELEAMYDKAYRAFDAANYTEALKQLDAIDARKPDLAASQNLRGVVYMRQGLYDKAEAALSEARGLDPKFWNARFNLAEIPFLKKDWADARKRFQELLTGNATGLQGEATQLIQYKILLTYLLEGNDTMVDSILAKFELSPDTPAVHYANAAI